MKMWVDDGKYLRPVNNYLFEPTQSDPDMSFDNQAAVSRIAPILLLTSKFEASPPLHPWASVVLAPSTSFSAKRNDDTWNNYKVYNYKFHIKLWDNVVTVRYSCSLLGPNGSPSGQSAKMDLQSYQWWGSMKSPKSLQKGFIESRMKYTSPIAI